MNQQPNRLPAASARGFGATEIDRGKPLSFRLNGRVLHGYAGDTVLSAALACGVTEAGTRGREALALDETFAPAVIPAPNRHEPHRALPMERTPATDGLDLLTIGARRPTLGATGTAERLRHLLYGPRRTLGNRFDTNSGIGGPWLDATADETIAADLVIVGAGIAGLSAALAAGLAGERVVVLERRPYIGGDAPYFGISEGEEPPQVVLPRLAAWLAQLSNVRILTRTEALSLAEGEMRAHQVAVADGLPTGRHLLLRAQHVLLAQGAAERLPVFPANRTPGVGGAVAAFLRAERFGVWIGGKALFSTVSSQAYRLAMRAADAGLAVQRIADTRPLPQSRFIDFSKASGIQLAFGLRPYAVEPPARGLTGLYAHFAAMDGRPLREPAWTEQLIVSGGWQPVLDLWLTAGGGSRWSAADARLEAAGQLPGVVLAGAAAGFRGTAACARSGVAAVARLFGREAEPVADPQIDPAYETPDAVLAPVSPQPGIAARPAYLCSGTSLAALPGYRPLCPLGRALGLPLPSRNLADHPRAFSAGDIAAAVQLGVIAADEAGVIAAERCLPSIAVVASSLSPLATPAAGASAGYLEGRFGPKPALWMVEPLEPRAFETGCLVYLNSEAAGPLAAIGVIVATSAPGARGAPALLGRLPVATGDRFVVRDVSGTIPVRVAERIDARQD